MELNHYDITVQHVIYYATGTHLPPHCSYIKLRGYSIFLFCSRSSSLRCADGTFSLDSISLVVALIGHCFWWVLSTASRVRTELRNVSFCWSADTRVFIFRSSCFRCMTLFTSTGQISIWDFYFDISEWHILPAHASTPALMLHLTNPCTEPRGS